MSWSVLTFKFFFGDWIFFMATILQLKVAKRRLFEKVSLERCTSVHLIQGIHSKQVVIYSAVLTSYWPSARAVLANISPRSWQYRLRAVTVGQYSPVQLELAKLVSSLLYGTRAMLVFNLLAFKNKKYTAYDHVHGNGAYGKISTKKEPVRTLGFALPYNKS